MDLIQNDILSNIVFIAVKQFQVTFSSKLQFRHVAAARFAVQHPSGVVRCAKEKCFF